MIIGITDRNMYESETVYLNRIDGFLKSNAIDYLILRDKDISKSDYSIMVGDILKRNPSCKEKIIIHTYADIAEYYKIKRVHLTQKDASLYMALQKKNHKVEEGWAVKYSCSYHPVETDMDALVKVFDFILISPVFSTTCKPDAQPLEWDLVKALNDKYAHQLVVLGGLNGKKIKALTEEGFKHFALRSGLSQLFNYKFTDNIT